MKKLFNLDGLRKYILGANIQIYIKAMLKSCE